MVSLQQTEFSQFSQSSTAIAFLRRSCTILSLRSDAPVVIAHRQTGPGNWRECGAWNLPYDTGLIGFYALETFYYFLVLFDHNNQTEAFFLDLNANLLNKVLLANSSGTIYADFDLKRKELLLLSRRGEIKSYAVRLVVTSLKGGSSESTFHVIYRMQTKILNDLNRSPSQIVCQDVPEWTIILTECGIVCHETSSLEFLWHITSDRFATKPYRLYVDKFSASFVVLCSTPDSPSGTLELWIPPTEFHNCNSSTFQRHIIHFEKRYIHIHIETIGEDYSTALMLTQPEGQIQLWLFHRDSELLSLQCSLTLTGSRSTFSAFHFQYTLSDSDILNPELQAQLSSSPRFGAFLPAVGFPGCKVLYFGLSSSGYFIVALHSPSQTDKIWTKLDMQQQTYDLVHNQRPRDDILDANTSPDFPQLSVPSVSEMNDSLSLDEVTNPHRIEKSVIPQRVSNFNSSALYFTPLSCFALPSNSEIQKDALLEIISPSGLILATNPVYQNGEVANLRVRRLCRSGLFPIQNLSDHIPVSSSLSFKVVQVALRSSLMVIVTELKEGFVFNISSIFNPALDSPRPIRLEPEIRPQAMIMCLCVSDILIRIDPTQVSPDDQKLLSNLEGYGTLGTHILSLIGDSDGCINFSVCGLTAALHQGSIRAHNSPIVSILSTGDSAKSLWKINTIANGPSRQLQLKACPGSAIVSLSKDGELKVWHPIFSQQKCSRSNPFQILSIFQLSWRISGLTMLPFSKTSTEGYHLTTAALDPTCLTCMIGTSDGSVVQCSLPGLVSRSNGKVQISKTPIWQGNPHQSNVTHISVWTNLPKTSISTISCDINSKSETKKYSHLVYDNTTVNISEEVHIGYTLQDLKNIAENTFFVSSSSDKTLSLWRFFVSRNMDLPEYVDVSTKRMYSHFKYLIPTRCRVFTFSSVPELSFCYPLLSQNSFGSIWRISTILNGIVVHIAQESKPAFSKELDTHDILFRSMLCDENIALTSMSVVCNIHKPHKTFQLSSKCGVSCQFSWEVFSEWQNEFILLPELPNPSSNFLQSLDLLLPSENTLNGHFQEITPPSPPKAKFVEIGQTLNSFVNPHCPQPSNGKKMSPTKGIPKPSRSVIAPAASPKSLDKMVTICQNGVYMRVPHSQQSAFPTKVHLSSHKLIFSQTLQKKFVVTKDKSRPPTATPTIEQPALENLEQDNSTETSGIVLSVQTPVPRRAPSLSEIDTSKFADFDFEIPVKPTDIEGGTENALIMSDDISSEASVNFHPSVSGDSMQINREKVEEGLKILNSKLVTTVGLAKKAFRGTLRPSLKQPYRNAEMSVPLPSKLKEIYEPNSERFIANPSKVDPLGIQRSHHVTEGVSVYRTPAGSLHREDTDFVHLFDGGLEKVPNSQILCSDSTKKLTFLQNPSSHFEKLKSPMFYKLTSLEKLLQRKLSSLQELNPLDEEKGSSDDYDDDDTFASELSGNLSTVSQIEAVKSLMGESEVSFFEHLSESEKMEFLHQKREENIRLIRESRVAFHSLLSNPPSLHSSDLHVASEDFVSSLDPSTISESQSHPNTVSFEKVMHWDKVEEATHAGVTQRQINDILEKTISKRRQNLADFRLNIHQFTKFAKELNKALIETHYPPEIKVFVSDIGATSCDIRIESSKFGTVFLLLLKSGDPIPITSTDFDNLETLIFRYKGVEQIITKPIHEKSTIEFAIKGLKPKTNYSLFCCAQHSNNENKKTIRATDDMIRETFSQFKTDEAPPEVLDIEWNRLKPIDQFDELAAVIFDTTTQIKAKEAGLTIPNLDALEKWLDAIEAGDLSGNESEGSEDSSSPNLTDVKKFVQWWTGDEYGFTEARSDFLRREAIFVCGDGETIDKCEDEGFLTLAQSAKLSTLVNTEDKLELLRSEEFIIFRSWLKGGRVIQEVLDAKAEAKREKHREKKRLKLLAKEAKRMEEKLRMEEEKENSDDDSIEAENHSNLDEPEDTVSETSDKFSSDEEDAEFDPRELKISERSQRLQERSSHVEDAIKAISNLHMAYRHGQTEGLSVRDLELKRGQLRMESITVIMAMKKLEELCEEKQISVKDLDEELYQSVSGASTFIDIPEDVLKAEMPPHATLLTLLGQDKRPLRAWDKCNTSERELELQLAGMISTIVELAIEAGVSVPSIEDAYCIRGPNFQLSRKYRWDTFEKWYIGNELHENQLKAIPTVARIMFTDWEKKHVKEDSKLRETILQRQSESTSAEMTNKKKSLPPTTNKPVKRMATSDLTLTVTKSAIDEDEIVKLYEIEVNKAGGEIFRCNILKKQVLSVLTSRNLSMLRLFWPPAGTSKPTSQFIFPRLGLITPKYEEPVKRFKPFPSRSSEIYSIEEVMAWYRKEDLLEDDEAMNRNELEGQKHQAYLNWLAEEEERMERGRLMMVEEDILSSKLRIHSKSIEIDRELPIGKPRYRDFMFGTKLPGQYDDIESKTMKFVEGSGVENEDEVQDVLEKMAKESELSLLHARELKRKQIEDRKKKEEEDRIRQEKLERDQRIEENKDRLKKIRENLENIKLARKIQEEERQRELLENEKRKAREAILQQELERKLEEKRLEAKMIEFETALMRREDEYHHYCREKNYNYCGMELEDELGHIRRETEKKKRERYETRRRELESLYEEYIPFQFDSNKIRNKSFHYPDEPGELDLEKCLPSEPENTQFPHQIDWKLFQQPNSISFSSLIQKPLCGDESEIPHKKLWPRSENISEIVPPLIWSGPNLLNEKKYTKLRKRSRPYTSMNPGEDIYTNFTNPVEPYEVLLSRSGIIDPLETIGISKSMLRSMKNGVATSTASVQDEDFKPLRPVSSEKMLPKLKTPSPTVEPSKFRQPNFKQPLVYRSNRDDLLIPSPPMEDSSQSFLGSKKHIEPIQLKNSPDLVHFESTPKFLSRKMKPPNILIDQLRSDREALRAFVSSSSNLSDDKFFLEACRPGLRSRDSINSNQIVQNYRQTLLKSYENSTTHESAIISAVKECMDDSLIEQSFPNHENSAVSGEDRAVSSSPSIFHSPDASLDGTSLDRSQEISLHPTSLHPSDLEVRKHEINVSFVANSRDSNHNSLKPFSKPPFSRELFGVKGQMKLISDSSPIALASQRTLMHSQSSGKLKETSKSRQRDEYNVLLKNSSHNRIKSYNLADVNFVGSK